MRESRSKQIPLSIGGIKAQPDVLQALLRFIYTGNTIMAPKVRDSQGYTACKSDGVDTVQAIFNSFSGVVLSFLILFITKGERESKRVGVGEREVREREREKIQKKDDCYCVSRLCLATKSERDKIRRRRLYDSVAPHWGDAERISGLE